MFTRARVAFDTIRPMEHVHLTRSALTVRSLALVVSAMAWMTRAIARGPGAAHHGLIEDKSYLVPLLGH